VRPGGLLDGVCLTHLAARATRARLVDEYQLFVEPAIVGGGNRFFDVRIDVELLDERRFATASSTFGTASRTADSRSRRQLQTTRIAAI
jgi:riboflavin biosynthesis pyrimidine reductase